MPLLLRQQPKLSSRLMSTALDVCGVRFYHRPRARGIEAGWGWAGRGITRITMHRLALIPASQEQHQVALPGVAAEAVEEDLAVALGRPGRLVKRPRLAGVQRKREKNRPIIGRKLVVPNFDLVAAWAFSLAAHRHTASMCRTIWVHRRRVHPPQACHQGLGRIPTLHREPSMRKVNPIVAVVRQGPSTPMAEITKKKKTPLINLFGVHGTECQYFHENDRS
jgi:hypothetical protein